MPVYTTRGKLSVAHPSDAAFDKLDRINNRAVAREKGALGVASINAAGDTGTVALTESQARNTMFVFLGAKTGATTYTLPPTEERSTRIWYDATSDSGRISIQIVGGTAVQIVKRSNVVTHTDADGVTLRVQSAWQDDSIPAAVSFGTDWGDTSGREVEIWKANANDDEAGGFIHLQGAVEKSTNAPANGDTMFTLPADYRPSTAVGFVLAADTSTTTSAFEVFVEITTGGAVIIRTINGLAIGEEVDVTGIKFQAGN